MPTPTSPARLRLLGLALFLPVPAVLALFTRQPLGVGVSLGLGLLLMASHRLYARPFALRHAGERCLWCGSAAGDGPELALREPLGVTVWRACGDVHRERLLRVFAWAGRWGRWLQAGILGGLVLLLALAPLAARGWAGPLQPADAVAGFQLLVAASVLPLSLLGPREPVHGGSGTQPLALPFPAHVQALIGTWAVLWLFRLVGLLWLWSSLRRLLVRA